jgi:hypothetical protein
MDGLFNETVRIASYDEAFEAAANGVANSISAALSQDVSEALADPIVQALMAADGVDRCQLKALLHRVASGLANREPAVGCHGVW